MALTNYTVKWTEFTVPACCQMFIPQQQSEEYTVWLRIKENKIRFRVFEVSVSGAMGVLYQVQVHSSLQI